MVWVPMLGLCALVVGRFTAGSSVALLVGVFTSTLSTILGLRVAGGKLNPFNGIESYQLLDSINERGQDLRIHSMELKDAGTVGEVVEQPINHESIQWN